MSDNELEGGIQYMCNLSQGVYDDALVDAILKFMKKAGMSLDDCLNILEIPEFRREMFKEMVDEAMTKA